MTDKFVVCLPDGMLDQLKAFAEANGCSLNTEIIERLAESLRRDVERAGHDEISHMLPEVNRSVANVEMLIEQVRELLGKN